MNNTSRLLAIIAYVSCAIAIISFLAGIIVYHHQNLNWDSYALWFIAIIPLATILLSLTSFLVDIKLGVDKNRETLERSVDQIDNYQRALNGKIEYHDIMTEIISRRQTIYEINDPILNDSFTNLLHRFSTTLDDMRKGHIYEYEPSNFEHFVTELFHHAQTGIKATSIVDSQFWERAEGIQFLEECRKLIITRKKNVPEFNITRYFLFYVQEWTDLKAKYKNVLQNQVDASITTKVVFLDRNRDVEKELYQDIGLIDDKIAIQDDFDETGKILKCDCYFSDRDRGKRYYTKIATLFTALEKKAINVDQQFLTAQYS